MRLVNLGAAVALAFTPAATAVAHGEAPVSARVSTDWCAHHRTTIAGGAGSQVIQGTARRDIINAGPGADVIVARQGNDIVCGGRGRDVILGGTGIDLVIGGEGKDWCLGGSHVERQHEYYECENVPLPPPPEKGHP